MSMEPSKLKVLFLCTGVGIYNRGIETFFREAYNGLRGKMPGIQTHLIKGGETTHDDETRIFCLPRTGKLAALLGKLVRRNSYVAEQWTFLPGAIRFIKKWKPDVIYYSDCNVAMQLYKRRSKIGVPFRLLYSNGAPLHPPYILTDHVQQVAPHYYDEAINFGEPRTKHSMVPYGFSVPAGDPSRDPIARETIRKKLGLPIDRKIILSVGAVNSSHKRMDYTINEMAQLPEPRPLLVMIGAFDHETPAMQQLARQKLGENGFICRSVGPEQVSAYYQSADIFVLSSLKEGFGRVYVEAQAQGLPVIHHDYPVMNFVCGPMGYKTDLSKNGALKERILELLSTPDTQSLATGRRQSVRERFSWEVLASQYGQMFRDCAASIPDPLKVK